MGRSRREISSWSEMSKFEYPRLPRHEIIAVLAENQIAAVSEADLLHPDPDFICNVYTHILVHVDALLEDYGQMEFGALEQLENPDTHVHSIQLMNLYNKIRELVTAINCPKSFTPKDLIKPEPDRTEHFLSALLNFYLHRETKINLLNPLGSDFNLFEERKLAAEARISQLNAEISECEESRQKELPLVQEVNSKVNELRQNVSSLNTHQRSLKASTKKLKDKAKESDEKISNAEFALVQCVQENANLRSKIVQSPDKLQRAVEEKKLIKTETKDAERAAIQLYRDKTTMVEAYSKVNSGKTVEKDVKVLKSKLGDDGVLNKSLEAKLVELQARVDQSKENKRQLEKERALNHEEVGKELSNVKLEVESNRRDLESRQRQVELMVAEADAIVSKISSVKEDDGAKMQELSKKYDEILTEFYRYSKLISNLLPAPE
ncbi:kinetochore protein NUF2 homolog isoform X2 [Primulina huaijiensis]|uniref:kinetochore protein NUF2 homolog isoform X2 n=1 Tax=Primulina huaijiensis TaxID=1492673 RepID=UPI003CC7682A